MDFVFPPRAGFFLLAWSRAGPICRCGARGLVGRLLRFDSSVAARALNRRGWLCSARRIVRERPAEAAQTARRRAARRESSLPEKYVERTPSTRSAGAQGQRQEAPRAGSPTPSTRREESGIARQA